MKIYKERIIPEHRDLIVEKRTCDLCGKDGANAWNAGSYDIGETEITVKIHQKEGEDYGEYGGSGTEYDIDLCPECFKNELVPWLKSQGADIQEKEWDY